jgi:site-specific DNA-cytosine methylase
MREGRPSFLEFFAGGGMTRAGLGPSWRCLFANDFDAMKVSAYTVETKSQYVTAVSSVADDMRARIIQNDPVRRPLPQNPGPVMRPRITNFEEVDLKPE